MIPEWTLTPPIKGHGVRHVPSGEIAVVLAVTWPEDGRSLAVETPDGRIDEWPVRDCELHQDSTEGAPDGASEDRPEA